MFIAFTRPTHPEFGISVMRADGSGITTLTTASDWGEAWGP